jgi:hypothetical protein
MLPGPRRMFAVDELMCSMSRTAAEITQRGILDRRTMTLSRN